MNRLPSWMLQCICIFALALAVISVMVLIYCGVLKVLSILAPLLSLGKEASLLSLAVLFCCILIYAALYIADVVGDRGGMLSILGMVGLAGFCYSTVIVLVVYKIASIIWPLSLVYLLLLAVLNYRVTSKRDL